MSNQESSHAPHLPLVIDMRPRTVKTFNDSKLRMNLGILMCTSLRQIRYDHIVHVPVPVPVHVVPGLLEEVEAPLLVQPAKAQPVSPVQLQLVERQRDHVLDSQGLRLLNTQVHDFDILTDWDLELDKSDVDFTRSMSLTIFKLSVSTCPGR